MIIYKNKIINVSNSAGGKQLLKEIPNMETQDEVLVFIKKKEALLIEIKNYNSIKNFQFFWKNKFIL